MLDLRNLLGQYLNDIIQPAFSDPALSLSYDAFLREFKTLQAVGRSRTDYYTTLLSLRALGSQFTSGLDLFDQSMRLSENNDILELSSEAENSLIRTLNPVLVRLATVSRSLRFCHKAQIKLRRYLNR
jgi:hypothetical protein